MGTVEAPNTTCRSGFKNYQTLCYSNMKHHQYFPFRSLLSPISYSQSQLLHLAGSKCMIQKPVREIGTLKALHNLKIGVLSHLSLGFPFSTQSILVQEPIYLLYILKGLVKRHPGFEKYQTLWYSKMKHHQYFSYRSLLSPIP